MKGEPQYRNKRALTKRQIGILRLVADPGSSVAIGLEAWQDLHYRGLLAVNQKRRYEITDRGLAALAVNLTSCSS